MNKSSSLPLSPPRASTRNANEFIEQQLDERIESIESAYTAHAICFSGPITGGVDDIIRTAIERRYAKLPPRKRLVVLLTTGGGYIEVVQRIVATMRSHYKVVDFVVPNYAYSAGTVLALSGDAIHMDYYSRLGPIDTQVENASGRLVPALGYVEKYNALLEKANKGKISMAEMQLLIQGFDQAELHQIEQARELSGSIHSQRQRPEPRTHTKRHEVKRPDFLVLVRAVSCGFVVKSFSVENE